MNEGRLHFEDCVLDLGRRELTREGNVVALQSRVFDLLHFLATHQDRVVGKDELLDAVWPGRVITEAALSRAVMKARKAVGDDASRQGVIRTVHGHGYRFVAEVRFEEEAPAPVAPVATSLAESDPATSAPASPGEGVEREPAAARPWLVPGALLVLLALILLWAWSPWRAPAPGPGELRIAVLPLIDRSDDPELVWTRLGLMSFVSGMLAEAGEIHTVADAGVLRLADATAWSGPLRGEATERLVDELQGIHGISHALVMELEPDATGWRMNWALQAPGEEPRLGTMVGGEATVLARGVVQAVYGDLLGRSHLEREAALVSADPFNNEAFARGMALSLEGRCAEAERYFQVITDAEPGLFAPRYELASCLRILGRSEEAEPLLRILVDERSAAGDRLHQAQAQLVLGILLNRTGRLDEAEAVEEEALAAAREVGDHELEGRILQNLAIIAEDRNEWAESEALLDRAVLAYQRAGREVLPGQVHAARANLAMDQGRLSEAGEHLERAVASFRAEGDRRNEAMMLNNTGYLRRQQGRLEEAEVFHRESLAIREDIGDRVGVGRIHGMLAVVLAARGDHEGAREAALSAREIAAESGDRLFEAIALAHIGDAEKALGDLAAAREAYTGSRDVFLAIDDQMRALQAELRIARLDLSAGETESAASLAADILVVARSHDLAQAELDAMVLLGDVALAAGERAQAALEYEAALARVRETGWEGRERNLLNTIVGLYLEDGELERAEPLVGALAALEPSAASLVTQARYAWHNGDATGAVSLMEQARVLAGDQWSVEDAAELEQFRQGAG